MFCANCGTAIEADSRFCSNCGAQRSGITPPPASAAAPVARAPVGRPPSAIRHIAVWLAIAVPVLAIVGGVGYWGWTNKVARDQAVQELANSEAAAKAAAAEQSAIKAARAALARHIAAEEAEAQAKTR